MKIPLNPRGVLKDSLFGLRLVGMLVVRKNCVWKEDCVDDHSICTNNRASRSPRETLRHQLLVDGCAIAQARASLPGSRLRDVDRLWWWR